MKHLELKMNKLIIFLFLFLFIIYFKIILPHSHSLINSLPILLLDKCLRCVRTVCVALRIVLLHCESPNSKMTSDLSLTETDPVQEFSRKQNHDDSEKSER